MELNCIRYLHIFYWISFSIFHAGILFYTLPRKGEIKAAESNPFKKNIIDCQFLPVAFSHAHLSKRWRIKRMYVEVTSMKVAM